ncbi:DinB family protein [Brevibacillus humidisoli]|uniref:DinB family protein n=1 Tax=Brevibacillus humidisoli TaxID=2895522 RepID=UPI001E3B1014|nr:DinB family protein [Brevibacillus humidisoli]UFJ40547.1 DinB family protein [Brevibacillus humidisoli]
MIKLFQYNWMVRDEWFELCKQVPIEELLRNRIGGAGSILYTLFHISDVEYSWIRGIQGKPDIQVQYENYKSLEQVKELSDSWLLETKAFLNTWSNDFENDIVIVPWAEGRYTKGELLRHVIAHEIHHIGQLSIWAREIGLQPISANVIGRGL